jgi:serine protease Do
MLKRKALWLAVPVVGVLLWTRGPQISVQFSPPSPAVGKEPVKLRELSDEFSAVVDKVSPSVVSIDAIKVIPGYRFPNLFGPFSFEDGFVSPEQRIPTVGSGVIVRADGYIVTNHHVIDGVREIRVTYSDKRVAAAKLIGSDATSDLAVLRVEDRALPAVVFGESKKLRIGEFVLAFGNPLGMQGSVSHGIVSGKDRKNLGIADYEDYIQTDAAINPGNSGGPLVNLDNEVVGINAAILSKSGGSQGIGLAIPSEVVKKVMEELILKGRIERSWLGMFVQPVSQRAAAQLGLPELRGLLVQGGYREGPAGQGGFRRYDVILECNNIAINDERQLRTILAQVPVGQVVQFKLWRERQTYDLKVKTQARPLDESGQPARGL